jgi:hypothetical protein
MPLLMLAMLSRRKSLAIVVTLVLMASGLIVYYLAPLSKIRVVTFNTQQDDTATVAIYVNGELETVIDLESREIATVTYRVSKGTYVFAFSWQYGSEAEEFPWLWHKVGFSPAAIPFFEVNIGHFESETLQWNV